MTETATTSKNETSTTRLPAANGELVNRVQQLRLNDQLGAGKTARGGASWLPWVLCGLMAVAWAGVGIRGYRNGAFSSAPATGGGTAASSGPASHDARLTVDALLTRPS